MTNKLQEEAERLATKFYGTPLPWCDMVADFEKALQVAFKAGAEKMRESAAKVCEEHPTDKNRADYTKDHYISGLQCAHVIRSLPLPAYGDK